MLCADRNAFWQEQQAAVENYITAMRSLVALVDHSAANPAFDLAHLLITAARGLCDTTQAALGRHEIEHGCQK